MRKAADELGDRATFQGDEGVVSETGIIPDRAILRHECHE